MSNTTDDIELRELILVVLGVFITGLVIPAISLFFFGGVTESQYFQKVTFYYAFGGIALSVLILLGIAEVLTKAKIVDFKLVGWARSLFFDTEISILGQLGFKKYLTPSNIFHFSILFFSIFGLFSVITNTFFIAIPTTTEFQVTETGDLLLSAEPAATSETLTFQVILAIGFGLAFWLWKTKKVGFTGYIIINLFTIFLNVVGWIVLHTARYGGSETKIFAVAMFALIGAILTLLSGSVITWYLYHLMNNLLLRAKELFGSDSILIGVIIFIIIYILLLGYFKIIRKLGQKGG